jgi:hypothetical protein
MAPYSKYTSGQEKCGRLEQTHGPGLIHILP